MSFVTQDDVFSAVEPVMRGVFEEFAGGKPVTPKFPLIPTRRRVRKYGTDKPDLRNPIEMQDVSRAFPRLRLQGVRADPGRPCQEAGLGHSGPERRLARVLRPDEFLGARRGPAGSRLHLFAEGGVGGTGPVANNIGPERTEQMREQLGLKEGDAVFFVAGEPAKFWKFAGLGAHQGSARSST